MIIVRRKPTKKHQKTIRNCIKTDIEQYGDKKRLCKETEVKPKKKKDFFFNVIYCTHHCKRK